MDYQGCSVSDFLHANGHVVLERVGNNCNLRSFTQKEIEEITNGYCALLGEGAFGKVYKGKLHDLRPVAVKRYKNGTKKEEFAKEVIVHSQINHKNVVKLLGCCTEENDLTIVMEFICNGSLYNILHCSNVNGHIPFPLEKRLDIAIESAEVLSCMHSMYSPVLHGDIKTANILLDENLQPKISDFGIARFLSAGGDQYTRSVVGCIGYMDPLFCQSGILTPKSDVYSFGVVLLEIIMRKKAVDGNTILAQSFTEILGKGKKVRQMFDEEIGNDKKNMKLLEDVAQVAAECLKMEVKMRPEMVVVADRLRANRQVFQRRKGISSTGTRQLICFLIKSIC
jgi:pto-interacting protein 1